MNELLPLVSVIMPVRNEGAYIERSLGAVLAQDYPADRVEVIVADGMSTDDTRDYVCDVMRTHPNVKLIDNPKRIAPTALNLATAAAQEGRVRVDGHCEIAPDYLSACVRHLTKDGVDGVGGGVDTVGETDEARAIAAAISSVFGWGDRVPHAWVRHGVRGYDSLPGISSSGDRPGGSVRRSNGARPGR